MLKIFARRKYVATLSDHMSSKTIKARVLRLVPPLDIKNTMIGQFCESVDGRNPGYEDDDSVPQGSRCATFCASVAYVKNARWYVLKYLIYSHVY